MNFVEYQIRKMTTRRGTMEYEWALLDPNGLLVAVSNFAGSLEQKRHELQEAFDLGRHLEKTSKLTRRTE